MRQLQKKIKNGTLNIKQDDPFELFVAATNIRYCYYNETHKILGNTFGMCVLQVGAVLREAGVSIGGAGGAPQESSGQQERGFTWTPLSQVSSADHWPLSNRR